MNLFNSKIRDDLRKSKLSRRPQDLTIRMNLPSRMTRDARYHEDVKEPELISSNSAKTTCSNVTVDKKEVNTRTHFLDNTTMTRLRQLELLAAASGAAPLRCPLPSLLLNFLHLSKTVVLVDSWGYTSIPNLWPDNRWI